MIVPAVAVRQRQQMLLKVTRFKALVGGTLEMKRKPFKREDDLEWHWYSSKVEVLRRYTGLVKWLDRIENTKSEGTILELALTLNNEGLGIDGD